MIQPLHDNIAVRPDPFVQSGLIIMPEEDTRTGVVVAVGVAEPDSVPVAERVPVRLAVADGVPVRVAVDEGVPVRLGVALGAATVPCPITTVRALASSTLAAPAAYS